MSSDDVGGSELRRRGGIKSVRPDSDARHSRSSVVARLRDFDVIAPKIEYEVEDQLVRRGGSLSGFVSLLMLIMICWLVISESWRFFVAGEIHETITVDVRSSERLPIRFNISFPNLRCSECNVDVVDKSGEQQLRLSHSIWKLRRSPPTAGSLSAFSSVAAAAAPVDSAARGTMPVSLRQRQQIQAALFGADPSRIGPELQLGVPIGRPFQDDGRLSLGDRDGEGCSIWGEILIQKLAGNMHIALGASRAVSAAQHVHNFQYSRAHLFNASHVLHELAFGEPFPGQPAGPLTGVRRSVRDPITRQPAIGHYEYYVDVVPTEFRRWPDDPDPLRTNQYSVTERAHVCKVFDHTMNAQTIPGLFINWELSPFLVQISQHRRGFLQFLTSLCAIVGGVFTVGGLVDSCLYHGLRVWRQRTLAP